MEDAGLIGLYDGCTNAERQLVSSKSVDGGEEHMSIMATPLTCLGL